MGRWRPRAILNLDDLPTPRPEVVGFVPDPLDDPDTPAAPAPTAGQINYFGRLIAYIPAEVIAVYQAVAGPVGQGDGTSGHSGADPAAAGIANAAGEVAANVAAAGGAGTGAGDHFLFWYGLLLVALTPVWLYFSTKDKGERPAWHQLVISTLAFFIWLLAVGNPIVTLWDWWRPLYGTAAMALAAIILFPLIEMMFKKRSLPPKPL